MRQMTLSITRRDIQKGERGSPYSCPIALALQRACAPGEVVHVGVRRVRIGPGCSGNKLASYRYACLSEKAMKFIDDFENGRPVKPITIILRFTACQRVMQALGLMQAQTVGCTIHTHPMAE